jgi:hypothetical protein
MYLCIYKLIRYLNAMVQSFLQLFTLQIPFYYVVTPRGNQKPLNDENMENASHLLVVYYTSLGIRYRFHELAKPAAASELMKAYKSFHVPEYRLLAITMSSAERSLSVPPEEFTVVGNCLGTKPFHYWLCRHYFHIPLEDLTCTVIDDNANLLPVATKLILNENEMVIE